MTDIEKTTTDLAHVLGHINAGILASQIEATLSDVAMNVVNHGGKTPGRVDIKLEIRNYGKNEDQIEVTAKIFMQKPKRYGVASETVGSEAIFFVGRGGKITYEQPLQAESGQLSLQQQRDGVVTARVGGKIV